MQFKVVSSSGKTKHEGTVECTLDITVEKLKELLSFKTRLPVHQQGVSVVRGDGDKSDVIRLNGLQKTLKQYNVVDADTFTVKDLGPQIGYRTVFVVEYAGPIAIMAAYASRSSLLYGDGAAAAAWNPVAFVAVCLWIAHFVKRELETFFVHKFSRPTMPMGNLFKNSIYYWGFALAVGFPLCHPLYTAPSNMNQVYLGAALMIAAEVVNLAVHLQLAMMRPAEGSDKREVPRGPLFALVSCPNYTAEVLSWVGFCIMTQVGLAYVFTLVGLAQMSQWALQKHKGYKDANPDYRKLGRKAIIPFVL